MANKLEMVKCGFSKKDCFANRKGLCMALREMPEGETCCFYKHKDDESVDCETKRLLGQMIRKMEREK